MNIYKIEKGRMVWWIVADMWEVAAVLLAEFIGAAEMTGYTITRMGELVGDSKFPPGVFAVGASEVPVTVAGVYSK